MTAHRAVRLAEEIKREIAQIFREELKDPGIGFASITRVEVSKDLRYAKVFVSVMGSPPERKKALEAMQRATGYIRAGLSQRIRVRFMPELTFKLDESIEQGVRIAKLIDQVREESHEQDNDGNA
ncbi:MAG: 30S ribosome-binding factor RbfA [Firmicutes bacterium]|nr:30S ribosome-binding factor RbfA [Bacillota bacterium]